MSRRVRLLAGTLGLSLLPAAMALRSTESSQTPFTPALSAASIASELPEFLDFTLPRPVTLVYHDGSVLAAFRGKTEGRPPTLALARKPPGQKWEIIPAFGQSEEAQTPSHITLVSQSHGPRTALAWISEHNGQHAVYLAQSGDAGLRFYTPVRIDAGHVGEELSIAQFENDDVAIAWIESAPDTPRSIALRLMTAGGRLGEIVRLPAAGTFGLKLAVDTTTAGTTDSARAITVLSERNSAQFERTIALPLPTAEADDCGCTPPDDRLEGYPIQGEVTATHSEPATVTVRHGGIPGLLAPGEHIFQVPANVPAKLPPGSKIFARARFGDDKSWTLSAIQRRVAAINPTP